jgi:hypothetical protein
VVTDFEGAETTVVLQHSSYYGGYAAVDRRSHSARSGLPRKPDSRTKFALVARMIPGEREPTKLEIDVHDVLSLSDQIVLRVPGEMTDGIRVANDRISTADDLSSDGAVKFTVEGRPSQGEKAVLPVCNILRQHLNRNSPVWDEPARPVGREEGVDCELPHRDGTTKLKVQVVRAEVGSELPRALSRGDTVSGNRHSDEIADSLKAAIEHKRTRAFGDIVLVLDATETPRSVFAPVISSFRKRYGAWAAHVGFKQIWVVGPIPDLVERLDIHE